MVPLGPVEYGEKEKGKSAGSDMCSEPQSPGEEGTGGHSIGRWPLNQIIVGDLGDHPAAGLYQYSELQPS